MAPGMSDQRRLIRHRAGQLNIDYVGFVQVVILDEPAVRTHYTQ
ncbi:hypothetical protein AB0M12_33425 [Nocardia vinacea]